MPRPPILRGAAGPRRPYVCQSCARRSPQNTRSIHDKTAARKEKEQVEWQQSADKIKAGKQPSMLSILESLGFIKDIAGSRAGLDQLLTSKRTAAYAGIDPTAPSLHLGHLLPFMILFHLYIHGYHTISLIGGATAKIGDPTGRLSSRKSMDTVEGISNLTSMNMQVRKLWRNLGDVVATHGYKKELSWRREVWNNGTWLSKLGMVDFLAVMGRGMRLGTMMGRDTVKNKMTAGDGMSFAEFTYPLLQAWDWWHMYSRHGVQVQIGGSDQYGNIVAGMDAIKYIQSGQQDGKDVDAMSAPYGITVPLLTTSSGTKFGKSAGNAVWLDADMTSPFDLYGFLLRSSDTDVHRYLNLFTFLPLDSISETMATHLSDPTKRIAQHLLARQVLELVHGAQIAKDTEQQHRLLRAPTLASLTSSSSAHSTSTSLPSTAEPNQRGPLAASVQKVILPKALVIAQPLAKILHSAGLAASKSEATRLIKSGGAYIGANTTWHSASPMDDSELKFRPAGSVTPDMVDGYVKASGVLVLRFGKWKVRVVEVVEDDVFEERGLHCPGWDEVLAQREELESVKEAFRSRGKAGQKVVGGEQEEEKEEQVKGESNVVDVARPSKDGKWRNNEDMFRRVG